MSRLPLFKGKYPQPRYAFERQRKASSTYDCTDRLHELHMPTLILQGKKDKISPVGLAEELHRGIAGSKMQTFDGGHVFFLMRGRQNFLRAIEAFISSS